MKPHFPRSTQNWLTLSGAMIALISLSMIVFLFVTSLFSSAEHTYLGLVIYILLPTVMIIGLLLIPLGMWLTVRKEKRTGKHALPEWPKMDLNDTRHRHAFFIFTIGTTIFLFLSAVGSYEAFHYTESVEFCGTLCHNLMIPEYTAYQPVWHVMWDPVRTGMCAVSFPVLTRFMPPLPMNIRGLSRRPSRICVPRGRHVKPATGLRSSIHAN